MAEYTLEWFDLIASSTFNPVRNGTVKLSTEQLQELISKIEGQKAKLLCVLKQRMFGIGKRKKAWDLVRLYYSELIIILNQAIENKNNSHAINPILMDVNTVIIKCCDELLAFIGKRFRKYFSLKETVPATYLSVFKIEYKDRLGTIQDLLMKKVKEKKTLHLILNYLNNFIGAPSENSEVSYKKLFYIRDLIMELELLVNTPESSPAYTPLDKMLIYMNFNDRIFVNALIENIIDKVDNIEPVPSKIDELSLLFKGIRQIPVKNGSALHPEQASVKTILNRWFKYEISYLKNRKQHNVVPLQEKQQKSVTKSAEKNKLISILSVDQMALILRAADDLKIVMARSLNSLFKNIVPHLSTPYQENISYDSMRSKSYSAETTDKEIVRKTLQQIVKKIDEY